MRRRPAGILRASHLAGFALVAIMALLEGLNAQAGAPVAIDGRHLAIAVFLVVAALILARAAKGSRVQ